MNILRKTYKFACRSFFMSIFAENIYINLAYIHKIMATEEYKSQLFRLAAVLYADNNYEVAPKTIHRKIIESVLLECGKVEFSIHEIIDFSQEKYGITLDESEIIAIIKSPKQEYFHFNSNNGDIIVCLTEKRRISLNEKINKKTIDYFIDEFGEEYPLLCKQTNYKDIIYHFLYDIFSNNTASFQKLLDGKKDLSGLINLESNKYTEKEKEIINNFLRWNNTDKNIAIFNISSYSLEYCMLTNKKGNSSVRLDDLKNKNFYLDTNIIYRALGINGDNRKKRSITFLNKFKEAGESLNISLSTNTEFKDSVKFYTDKIRRYSTPRINSRVYEEFNNQSDVFDFYHKWRIGKVNTSIDLFESYVFSLYDDFIKNYSITIDKQPPFDSSDSKVEAQLKDLTSSISNYKQQEGNDYIGSALIDAENILWIETKREGKNLNIFETKFFFVSTDQALRRWDYQRANSSPIVMLPSQWMSILLRYFNCTSDDYKSFVSFLNLQSNDVIIDSEKLHVVLAGISQMTENIEYQRFLLKNLVETKFNGVIEKGIGSTEIFERSKVYAKTQLEKNLEELKSKYESLTEQHQVLSQDMENNKKSTDQQIEKIKKESIEKGTQLSTVESENKRLKKELKRKYVAEQFKNWKKPAYWLIPIAGIIIIFTLLQFILKDTNYNYVYKLICIIDNLESETQKTTLRALLYAPLIGLWLIVRFCWSRLFSSEKRKEKKAEFESSFKDII